MEGSSGEVPGSEDSISIPLRVFGYERPVNIQSVASSDDDLLVTLQNRTILTLKEVPWKAVSDQVVSAQKGGIRS